MEVDSMTMSTNAMSQPKHQDDSQAGKSQDKLQSTAESNAIKSPEKEKKKKNKKKNKSRQSSESPRSKMNSEVQEGKTIQVQGKITDYLSKQSPKNSHNKSTKDIIMIDVDSDNNSNKVRSQSKTKNYQNIVDDDDWMSDDDMDKKMKNLRQNMEIETPQNDASQQQKKEIQIKKKNEPVQQQPKNDIKKSQSQEKQAENVPISIKSPKQTSPIVNEKLSEKAQKKFDRNQELDQIISQLLSVQNKPVGTLVTLKMDKVQWLIDQSLALIQSQPMLLRIQAPVTVGTDIHGQYYDLLRFFNLAGGPPETSYLFLGDYVDRGKQSIESLCLLLAYKLKYPNKIHMLRGNHECQNITRIYGFWDECKRRYKPKIWRNFINLFNHLPVCALVNDKILCMHGGLSPDLKSLKQIENLTRPTLIPENGVLCDLLWSDPASSNSQFVLNLIPKRWGESDRGVSYVFGEKVVHEFLQKHGLDLIVRGHQVMEDGYEFFASQKLVTLFSAPNYCNEFDNDGAMLKINADLCCSFFKMTPAEKNMSLQQKEKSLPWFKGGRPSTPQAFY